jgi:hypothetical protein
MTPSVPYRAAIEKIRSWDPGFNLFGEDTSYFGMAVVHNLQVSLRPMSS